jgi:uroporphyrinogen decarboxylase
MAGMSPKQSTKPLLRVLAGETLARPPWWLMRQAGRYLPEYRAVREQAGDFVSLCLTPRLAAEVTLQPIRRYGMDAAILFSDILLVPRVLGQPLTYEADGPHLAPIADTSSLRRLDETNARSELAPVGEAAARVCDALSGETALIGFAGAPWTVATYMVEGGTSRDFQRVKSWAFRDPHGFGGLIDLIVEATLAFLELQIAGGVEVVQLFDSWAGVLPADGVERWVIAPTKRIVVELKRRHPDVSVIGFPRGAGLMIERYIVDTGVDAVSLDTAVPPIYARALQSRIPVQGNLDPVLLRSGGAAMRDAVEGLRATLGDKPYVFNLGHGVLPDTPPEHVAELAQMLSKPITT